MSQPKRLEPTGWQRALLQSKLLQSKLLQSKLLQSKLLQSKLLQTKPDAPNRARRQVATGLASLLAGLLLPVQARAALPPILPFEPDTLQKIVAGQRGQPFWLVLWDLNCPYCIVSLRLLGERQRTNPDLRVLSVATDSIEEADTLAARLQELGVRGAAFAFGEAAPEALRYAIDPAWRGEKPRSYYYDANGKRKLFVGVLRSEQLQPLRP